MRVMQDGYLIESKNPQRSSWPSKFCISPVAKQQFRQALIYFFSIYWEEDGRLDLWRSSQQCSWKKETYSNEIQFINCAIETMQMFFLLLIYLDINSFMAEVPII